MPRYSFHIRESLGLIEDDEGTELADLDAARTYAVTVACELMRESLRNCTLPLSNSVEISDGSDTLASLPFTRAVSFV